MLPIRAGRRLLERKTSFLPWRRLPRHPIRANTGNQHQPGLPFYFKQFSPFNPPLPFIPLSVQHNPSPCHASPSCPSASSLGYSPTPMPSALPPSRPSQSPPAPPHPSPIFNNGKLKNKGSNSEYANPHYQLTPATSPIPNKRLLA